MIAEIAHAAAAADGAAAVTELNDVEISQKSPSGISSTLGRPSPRRGVTKLTRNVAADEDIAGKVHDDDEDDEIIRIISEDIVRVMSTFRAYF